MTVDFSIIDLALANLLDLIPMISNTDENVDSVLIRFYERNAAIVNGEWEISPSQKFVDGHNKTIQWIENLKSLWILGYSHF